MLKRQEKGGLFGGGPQHGNQAKGALSSFATKDQEGKVTIDTKGLRQAAEEAIGTRFTMRQDLVSIAEDFWIKNERGEKVIRVDGKLLRLRDVLLFEDRRGHELYTIKARMVSGRRFGYAAINCPASRAPKADAALVALVVANSRSTGRLLVVSN